MMIFKYFGIMMMVCSITALLIASHYIDMAFNMDYLDVNGFNIIRTKQEIHRDGLNLFFMGIGLNIVSLAFLILPQSDKTWLS